MTTALVWICLLAPTRASAECPAADASEALANAAALLDAGILEDALECYRLAAGSAVSAEAYAASVAIADIEERRGRPWQAVRALENAFIEGSPADRLVLERRIRRLALLAATTAPGLSVDERCAAAETLLRHGPTADERAQVRDATPTACGLAPKPAPATPPPPLPAVPVDPDRDEGSSGVGYDIAGGTLLGLAAVSFGLATWFWAGEMGDAIDRRDLALRAFALASDLDAAGSWADSARAQDARASDARDNGWISLGVGAGLALTGVVFLIVSPDDPEDVSLDGRPEPTWAIAPAVGGGVLGSRATLRF